MDDIIREFKLIFNIPIIIFMSLWTMCGILTMLFLLYLLISDIIITQINKIFEIIIKIKYGGKMKFYCKKCKKEFFVDGKISDGYWNWKCPICDTISMKKDYNLSIIWKCPK